MEPRGSPRRLADGRLDWRLFDERRNRDVVDWWSLAHVAWGFALAMALPPEWALAVMVVYEPVEVLVVSPLLARVGVSFGYESLRNTIADIVFDVLGVALAAFVVRPVWNPLAGLL